MRRLDGNMDSVASRMRKRERKGKFIEDVREKNREKISMNEKDELLFFVRKSRTTEDVVSERERRK